MDDGPAAVGVRPVEDEEVREARHGDAEERAGPPLPGVVDAAPVAPLDLDSGQEAGRLEPGAQDQHVHLPLGAGGIDDPGWRDPGYLVRHELHVGSVERLVLAKAASYNFDSKCML